MSLLGLLGGIRALQPAVVDMALDFMVAHCKVYRHQCAATSGGALGNGGSGGGGAGRRGGDATSGGAVVPPTPSPNSPSAANGGV